MADQGVTGLVVHVGDKVRFATATAAEAGLEVPMLLDVDKSVNNAYTQTAIPDTPPYPLDYLVDKEGVIRDVQTTEERRVAQWRARIEELLAE